jgi:isopentenyldiphosphate isomerase
MMTLLAQDPDEIFDVVDDHNKVIGRASRRTIHAQGLKHRSAHIFWLRSDGLLCLQRRSYQKDSCPGLLSSSCAGHLDAGEAYLPAALRELREENGIEVSPTTLVRLDAVAAHPDLGYEFVEVFLLKGDYPVRIHPPEVDALLWRTPRESEAWLSRQPELFSSSFAYLLHRPAIRLALGLA